MENVTIKLFLASSITEFEMERYKLSDFINSLNQIYHDRGIFFELWKCEDHSKALASGRKQEEYNQKIRECEYFYTLIGTGAGEYTLEEFEVALEHFRQCESPKIYTYFRNLPEGEPPEQSRETFMERLDKGLGHYYSMFSHLDTVKLDMLIDLTKDLKILGKPELKNGMVLLNGIEILSADNILIYSKNGDLQQLLEEKARLDTEWSRLHGERIKCPDNAEIRKMVSDIDNQRKEVGKQIRDVESNILNLYMEIYHNSNSGDPDLWRLKKTDEFLESGNYEAALSILRDDQRKAEREQIKSKTLAAKALAQIAKKDARDYILESKRRIQIIMTLRPDQKNLSEIYDCFEDCLEFIEEYQVELDVLFDYASFLRHQNQVAKAIEIAERLDSLYNTQPAEPDEVVWLKNLLGLLHEKMDYDNKAEGFYIEALELCATLADADAHAYERLRAIVYNNLADLHEKQNRLKDAKDLYKKSIEILEQLAYRNLDYHHEGNLAVSYHNLASLFEKQNRLKEAGILYKKSLEIQERLASENPVAYENGLATYYNNLGYMYETQGRLNDTEKLYEKALEIRKRLTSENLQLHGNKLALSCNSLANLYQKQNRLKDAENLYNKAIEILEQLTAKNPEPYEKYLAISFCNLGHLHEMQNCLEDAKCLYKKAIEIQERLVYENPETYESDLALSCIHLAGLSAIQKRLKDAESLYKKALQILEPLARDNPETYESDLALVCNDLAYLHCHNNNKQSARELIKKAVELTDRISERNQNLDIGLQANIYRNFVVLHADRPKRRKECEIYCQKALSLYDQLSSQDPDVYNQKIDNLKHLLNEIRSTPAHPKKKKRK